MGRVRLAAFAFLVLMLAPLRANAAVHLWQIKEVFSNESGSIQYIELFTTSPGQTAVATHTLTVNDGNLHSFTFPNNLTVDTQNKHLLIATDGFRHLPGAPTPDYTLPCGAFFDPTAASITINFAESTDVITFTGAMLPKDGINSLTDTTLGAAATLVSSQNSPTNISGAAGPVTLSAGQNNGSVNACDDGMYCNGPETCSAGACAAGVAACEDNNPCTDDTCTESSDSCTNVAHVGSCDDGLFCNGADTCSGTTCIHAGDPCGGINCNEGPDTCANCTGAPDCEDGEPCTVDTCNTGQCNRATAADGAQCDSDTTYCNGVGACTTGVCGAIAAPCDSMTETCEESNDSCTPIPVTTPDASVDPGIMTPDDEGGCCQANTSPATFTGPGLVLLLGLAFGRRRRRR